MNRQAPRASEEQIDDKLNKLAAKFAAIVNGKKDNSEAVDAEVKVVQDESLSSGVYIDDLARGAGEGLQEPEQGST